MLNEFILGFKIRLVLQSVNIFLQKIVSRIVFNRKRDRGDAGIKENSQIFSKISNSDQINKLFIKYILCMKIKN